MGFCRLVFGLVLLTVGPSLAKGNQGSMNIVASLAPIHSIAASIMQRRRRTFLAS